MLFAATAATPESESDRLPLTFGLATTFHRVPVQCSTSVRPPLPLPSVPTAHTFFTERAVTPFRKLVLVPTFGLATVLHTPQALLPRVNCATVAPDASAHPLKKRAASTTTAIPGKITILKRF